ncbi:hypothetical protein BDW02DRAFT_566645 [Decorospora gaudefroyi]|uniref:Uncharacterized protein n=1 Tax=Decorospora gaudefroyi TaxID=184978 RepID=A0A6A5KP21_9PLEO|nr:hypothetical protein BDW02DRAFT_566645 [Decorospora gaudefroyi]
MAPSQRVDRYQEKCEMGAWSQSLLLASCIQKDDRKWGVGRRTDCYHPLRHFRTPLPSDEPCGGDAGYIRTWTLCQVFLKSTVIV